MDLTIESLLAWKGVAIAIWLAIWFMVERMIPAAAEPNDLALPGGWRRVLRNMGLWFVNVAISPLVVVPITAWAAAQGLGWRPAWWGGPWGLVLDIVILDGLIYWWHRANHVVPILWRFHEVHHLDRFLDSTSALRFHFGEVFFSACARAMVVILLAVPLASVLVFEALVLAAAIFHHSNVRLPERLERILSKCVVTPSIHWVHHHAVRADTDSNYATILSLWDRLFVSRSPTQRQLNFRIGVERRAEQSLWGLVVSPFRIKSVQPRSSDEPPGR